MDWGGREKQLIPFIGNGRWVNAAARLLYALFSNFAAFYPSLRTCKRGFKREWFDENIGDKVHPVGEMVA